LNYLCFINGNNKTNNSENRYDNNKKKLIQGKKEHDVEEQQTEGKSNCG
jgi:hypothetical protein